MKKTISHSDITVVVQGPVVGGPNDDRGNRLTHRCLESVRQHLPGARIVLSTWEDSDLGDLDYDNVVLNKDPGGFFMSTCRDPKILNEVNNVNRQIVSTAAGIKLADRNYILKLRSDIKLKSDNFLKYYGKYLSKGIDYCILDDRIVTCSFFARNPRTHESPFHPSDWVSFGNKSDLTRIWNIPLIEETEQRWFLDRARPKAVKQYYKTLVSRYNTEQYLWIGFLRKHGYRVSADHMFDVNDRSIIETEMSFANNLVIISPAEFGIKFLKTFHEQWLPQKTITHHDWLRLYSKYCDPTCNPPLIDFYRILHYFKRYWP